MRHPINCTWGFHRPPQLPERQAATCPRGAARISAADVTRQWSAQPNMGMFMNYHGVQTWSINERVADFYRQYI